MAFVTQFNYFKKSIDSIFYSTPQIFEEIMALRHSLLTFKQVGCHCFLFIISLPMYYTYELPLCICERTFYNILNTSCDPKNEVPQEAQTFLKFDFDDESGHTENYPQYPKRRYGGVE